MRGRRRRGIRRCCRPGWSRRRAQQAQASTAGQAEGSIAADQAAIQAAKVNLGYTKIISPINGVVGLRQVDPGNIVHATDTNGLLVVTQLQPIAVIFTLPEDQLPEVLKRTRGGSRLAVEAYRSRGADASGEREPADGRQPDRYDDGHGEGEGGLRQQDGALFPNQFVNVRLILQEKRNAIVIPAAALQTGTQGNFVYLLKAGSAAGRTRCEKEARMEMCRGAAVLAENRTNYYVEAQSGEAWTLTEGTQVISTAG